MAKLGLIEGYYGEPWSDEARERVIAHLAPHGYRFFIYAPKADAYLRRRWREPFPLADEARLRKLAEHCKAHGVAFGVGLSPYEAYRDFDAEAQAALAYRHGPLGQWTSFNHVATSRTGSSARACPAGG